MTLRQRLCKQGVVSWNVVPWGLLKKDGPMLLTTEVIIRGKNNNIKIQYVFHVLQFTFDTL